MTCNEYQFKLDVRRRALPLECEIGDAAYVLDIEIQWVDLAEILCTTLNNSTATKKESAGDERTNLIWIIILK